MASYRLITPYFVHYYKTLPEAKRAAHAGLDRIAAKRGYSMTVDYSPRGEWKFTVLNSKGKPMTGCRIIRSGSRTARAA
jgi:hypothetical protein